MRGAEHRFDEAALLFGRGRFLQLQQAGPDRLQMLFGFDLEYRPELFVEFVFLGTHRDPVFYTL